MLGGLEEINGIVGFLTYGEVKCIAITLVQRRKWNPLSESYNIIHEVVQSMFKLTVHVVILRAIHK